jgi:MFS transporter, putative metabolite:H+ symporter
MTAVGQSSAAPDSSDGLSPENEDRFARLRPWCVGFGVLLVVAGVLLHLPDLRGLVGDTEMSMEPMHMGWSPIMISGMALNVAGILVAIVGLFVGRPRNIAQRRSTIEIEHGKPRPIYWVTCLVLSVALVIDTMKPLTIGFVMPGMAGEYGMSIADVAMLQVVALIGTVVGSVVWGILGDRYGRRPGLMLATILFIGTSVCGAMPAFGWNLVMCFTMGASAGGMLPLVFTLISELSHRKHRRWVMVTVGAVGGLVGYLAASVAAHTLEPLFTWRSLWLIGLPTGLLLVALLPLIPESPLYLLRQGHRAAAEQVLARYGARLAAVKRVSHVEDTAGRGVRELLNGRMAVSAAIALAGLSWGLVNFGFLGLLPAQLSQAGEASSSTSALLARATLFSAPALLVVVLLYAFWSTRRSLILFVASTAVALIGVVAGVFSDRSELLLTGSVGLLVLTLAAVNAVLVPYSTELYPTAFRARGASLAAASTKLGGVLGPFVMLIMLHVGSPGLSTVLVSAILFGVISLVAAIVLYKYGRVSPAAQ